MDLFNQQLPLDNDNVTLRQAQGLNRPLADRVRPESLEDFVGQEKLVGEGKILRRMIEADQICSMIFWGPPGSGKTTLARIMAKKSKAHFVQFSAVTSGVKDVRKIVAEAKTRLKIGQKTILFVDELHRFNKAQQDAFLPYVEDGTIILIGATTENPSFEVIGPLLSRSRVFILEPLSKNDILKIIERALNKITTGDKPCFRMTEDNRLRQPPLSPFTKGEYKQPPNPLYQGGITPEAKEFLAQSSGGDARIALNALEVAMKLNRTNRTNKAHITQEMIEEALQHKALLYDKKGDEHYNVISAFIKSLRGSDPDAALYWLARMIEAGEDPKFIARRMIVFASEDIGNADPRALEVANAVASAVEFVGMPEARINLAQGVTYLACAPKSNASYAALEEAQKDVKETGALSVPLHLRNAPTGLMKELGYGRDYKYPHHYPGAEVKQDYLPEELRGRKYYQRTNVKFKNQNGKFNPLLNG